jgi:hypothetical protein
MKTFCKIFIVVAIMACVSEVKIMRGQTGALLINDNGHSQERYYTKSGIRFWDDWEVTNQWHTICTVGTNDYQAAVVVSNYFTMQVWEGRTNRVELLSSNLPLAIVPMRIVPSQTIYATGDGTIGTILGWTNFNFYGDSISHRVDD